MQLYSETAFEISEKLTKKYSTSFYSATRLLNKEHRKAIFSVYGFVRLADEIVDTFHEYDKKFLISKLEEDLVYTLKNGISINPVLHSFQKTVKKYNIDYAHINAFLESMKADLNKKIYQKKEEIDEYIYGSADVVGLMCLKIFCDGNQKLYNELEKPAMSLGSAFQKVNFLRDLKDDINNLDRKYFPQITENNFDEKIKKEIIADIQKDFENSLLGIKKLPGRSKLAVLTAYQYYKKLLQKTNRTPAKIIAQKRIRVNNFIKMLLLIKSIIIYNLKLI